MVRVDQSDWRESIDRAFGRMPWVSGTPEGDVIYELVVQGGILRDELWLPAPRTCLVLRCDERGNIFARVHHRGRRRYS